jgi:hypothetical protein
MELYLYFYLGILLFIIYYYFTSICVLFHLLSFPVNYFLLTFPRL